MSSRTAFVAAVLIANLPLPIQAHDIYSPLRDRWGRSCCDDGDCQPAQYRQAEGGVKMLVDGRWIDVPDHAIQYRALPGDTGETGGGHWCGFADKPSETDLDFVYTTRCAILPPQSASAH